MIEAVNAELVGQKNVGRRTLVCNVYTKESSCVFFTYLRNESTDRPTDQPTKPTKKQTNRPTNQPTNKSTNQPTNKLTNQQTN
jgi:hypothetical protein